MATKLSGRFGSRAYAPGFCHGYVEADMEAPLVDGATVDGVVVFEYEGAYRAGQSDAVGVRVSRTGDTVRVVLRGWNIMARLAGLSFEAGTIRDGVLGIGYRLAMPFDEGTVELAFPHA